jgi:transposase
MGRGDLTNEQWARLEPLLPTGKKAGRPPTWSKRQLINGIRWRTRTGAPWRDVPARYGPWQTVYGLFRRWQRDGTWQQLLTGLQAQADARGLINWEVKLLVRHRERLVAEHTPGQAAGLGWQLHQLDPTCGTGDQPATRPKPAPQHRMARAGRLGGVQVSTICQIQVAVIGSLTAQLGQLDRERCQRVTRSAPNLLAWPGGGTLTAAKPSSSPRPPPWPGPRQLRSPAPVADGNRQLHAVALHRIAITRLRLPGPPRPTTSGAAPRMTSPARPCPPLRRRIVRAVYRRHLKQAQQPSTTAAHGRAEEQPTPRAAR